MRIDTRQADSISVPLGMALLVYGLTVLAAGCAGTDRKPVPAKAAAPVGTNTRSTNGPIMTPASSVAGRVVAVNNAARFVVLNYSFGFLPPLYQHLNVYRKGQKVGELKVSGPQQDTNTAADLLTGEVQIGDEARPD